MAEMDDLEARLLREAQAREQKVQQRERELEAWQRELEEVSRSLEQLVAELSAGQPARRAISRLA
jgi:hypothetical protein